MLTSGRVRVMARQNDRPDLLVALRGSGDLVGELTADPTGVRTASVVAIDHCTAGRLPFPAFRRILAAHDRQEAFTDYMVSKLSQTVPFHVQLAQFSPTQRLARLLLEIVALADPGTADPSRVPLPQETIAHALHLSRSTVAKEIAALRVEGVLAPGPRLRVLDRRQLAILAVDHPL
ncbi:cAMP-binding protein [Actinokineospora spheciospongiae]|uniref:cAMP-binding protein n=2 Tax=Actinokineospora spheciospongiae TaxID=909613 RepID=W7JE14_9PSEU|nr:cAMP-binding protein [Actinokineospora spheciospongiae]PWW64726.1 CRP-like cAMP-binding protein [Actinokineospora spheciospongiae]